MLPEIPLTTTLGAAAASKETQKNLVDDKSDGNGDVDLALETQDNGIFLNCFFWSTGQILGFSFQISCKILDSSWYDGELWLKIDKFNPFNKGLGEFSIRINTIHFVLSRIGYVRNVNESVYTWFIQTKRFC